MQSKSESLTVTVFANAYSPETHTFITKQLYPVWRMLTDKGSSQPMNLKPPNSKSENVKSENIKSDNVKSELGTSIPWIKLEYVPLAKVDAEFKCTAMTQECVANKMQACAWDIVQKKYNEYDGIESIGVTKALTYVNCFASM